ncbi:MAG: hypothetical protein SGI74_03400, partial [Oligoflexia bacterium]|nr:hypothetical protein [Oligoflexia bacterium]
PGTPGCDLYLGVTNGQLYYEGNLTIDSNKGSKIIQSFYNCKRYVLFGQRTNCSIPPTSARIEIIFNPTVNGQPPTARVVLDVGGYTTSGIHGSSSGSGVPLTGLAQVTESSATATSLFFRPDMASQWTFEVTSTGNPLFPIDQAQANRNISIQVKMDGGYFGHGLVFRRKQSVYPPMGPGGYPGSYPGSYPGGYPGGYTPPFTPPTF